MRSILITPDTGTEVDTRNHQGVYFIYQLVCMTAPSSNCVGSPSITELVIGRGIKHPFLPGLTGEK